MDYVQDIYIMDIYLAGKLDELSIFFFNVWLFYVYFLTNAHVLKSKIEFINAIYDHKLS